MIPNLNKIIEEAVSGVKVTADYTKPDGTAWAKDPHPIWLWLGTWTTSRGNRSIGAINLNKVVAKYGQEGIDALRRWLPEILGIVPIEPEENVNLQEEGIDETLLDNGHILLLEVDQRPLKSTSTVRGRYDTGAYDIPDPIVNKIFGAYGHQYNCYETPLIGRMSNVNKGKINSIPRPTEEAFEKEIPKTKEEALAKAEQALDKVEQQLETLGPPPKEEIPVATVDEPMSKKVKAPEEVEAPPEAPPTEEKPTEVLEEPKEVPPKEKVKPEDPVDKAAAEKLVEVNIDRDEEDQPPITGISNIGKEGTLEIVDPAGKPKKILKAPGIPEPKVGPETPAKKILKKEEPPKEEPE